MDKWKWNNGNGWREANNIKKKDKGLILGRKKRGKKLKFMLVK